MDFGKFTGVRTYLSARVLASLSLVAASCVSVLALPSTAFAADCVGGWGNKFNGYYADRSSTGRSDLRGIRGVLDMQDAGLCSNAPDGKRFTAAWVMLTDRTNGYYAQVGYERGYGFAANGESTRGYRYFAQYVDRDPGLNFILRSKYSAKQNPGGSTAFKVDYGKACPQCTAMSIAGDVFFAGSTNQWAFPYGLQIAQEAARVQDDTFGVASNRMRAYGLKYQDRDSGNLIDMPCGIFDTTQDSPRWKKQHVSCTQKNFWTDPVRN